MIEKTDNVLIPYIKFKIFAVSSISYFLSARIQNANNLSTKVHYESGKSTHHPFMVLFSYLLTHAEGLQTDWYHSKCMFDVCLKLRIFKLSRFLAVLELQLRSLIKRVK